MFNRSSEEAVRDLLKGFKFSERVNNVMWSSCAQYSLGDAYFDMGEFQKSQNHYNEAASILDQNNNVPSFSNICKIGSARAKIMNTEKDVSLELVYGYHDKNRLKFYDGSMARYIGEILLNIDDQHVSKAEEWINKAIKADKKNDTRWHLGRDYALYAELFKRKGDQPKVKEKLGKAIEIFRECCADGWVKKYEKELASVS